jgi:hypothetical protein
MEITSVAGLPAHPLVVHLPVVLLPLAALAAVVMLAWPRSRRALAPVVAALAGVGALGAVLAAGSGEALQERLPDLDPSLVHDHAELGELARNLAILFLIAAAAYLATTWPERLPVRRDSRAGRVLRARRTRVATSVAVAVTAVAVTAGVVQAGHTGATAVWTEEWRAAGAAGPPSVHAALPMRAAPDSAP